MDLFRKMPKKIKHICLDLDDVLVDFEGAAEKLLLGRRLVDVKEQRKFWFAVKHRSDLRDKMWKSIASQGSDWWLNLKKLQWADDLWEISNRISENVLILSSPGNDPKAAPSAAEGKVAWSFKEFGSNRVCLITDKYLCSGKDVILVDDLNRFIKPWENSGGFSIKLRKRWEHRDEGYTPDHIIKALKNYLKK